MTHTTVEKIMEMQPQMGVAWGILILPALIGAGALMVWLLLKTRARMGAWIGFGTVALCLLPLLVCLSLALAPARESATVVYAPAVNERHDPWAPSTDIVEVQEQYPVAHSPVIHHAEFQEPAIGFKIMLISPLLIALLIGTIVLIAFRPTRPYALAGLALLLAMGLLGVSFRSARSARMVAMEEATTVKELANAPATHETLAPEGYTTETIELDEKPAKEEPPAPEWVTGAPKVEADGTYVTSVAIGPYPSVRECWSQMPATIARAAYGYMREELWTRSGDYVGPELPMSYIRENIAQLDGADGSPYIQRREHAYPLGDMYTMHVRLKFTPQVQQHLRELQRQAIVRHRTGIVAAIAGIVLLLVGIVFAYLKWDTATKGYYTGRLQAGAAAVTVVVLVLGALLLA